MSEDNQIQPWFQPENQVNPQTQQNNFIQEQQQVQETSQQVDQQNNIEVPQQNLSQNSKPHKSWLTKILTGISFLVWFGLIWFWIHDCFEIWSSWRYYSSNSIWNIILNNWTWAFFLVWIFFIIIWTIKLFHNQKSHKSWLVKIVSRIVYFLWLSVIWLCIYSILRTASDSATSTYSIREIIIDSWFWILWPIWILFILIWILSYNTPDVDIYYHPSRLTKILSGIYRFLWIALVWAGLRNFSLIWTDDLPFLKILYVWWIISLCWIWYILLWRLLYSRKNRIHLWISLLLTLVVSVMLAWILREFTDYNHWYWIDNDLLELPSIVIIFFNLIYFSISTIRWSIKCRKFYKKWIINPKYLNIIPSNKKIWYITVIILFLLIMINLIYGKFYWSKIPKVDESILVRTEKQIKLPDEKDALVQLKSFNSWYINTASILSPLDSYYMYEWSSNNYSGNSNIWREQHIDECVVVNSWWNEYCGTWTWNKKTLERFLNNYYYIGYDNYMKDFVNSDWYLSIDWKKITVFEYIQKNESEIMAYLQNLDQILSLDYSLNFSLPRDNPYYLLPQFLQWYTRANMIILQYYTLKEDWEMVEFIININYKMVNILNNYWSTVPHLISFVIQNITDSNINSLIKLFHKDFRIQLSKWYSDMDYNKEWMLKERTKWEYNILWKNWAKDAIFTDIWSNEPSLIQFMFHFPFLSKRDINRFMDYAYYNLMYDENFDFDNYLLQLNLPEYSLYNYYWTYPYLTLRPRISTYNTRLKYSLFHKQALIDNLNSWDYKTLFNKLEWGENPDYYNEYRILTNEELFKNKIKEYSNITNPCFWEEVLNPEYNPYYYKFTFWNECIQTLSKLKNLEDDDFWLKKILIEITELYIDYSEIVSQSESCLNREWICENLLNKQNKILDKLENNYITFMEILENIKNKIPEINTDEYFYIPEMIHNKRDKLDDLELNDTKLNDLEFEDIELPESMNIIKEYSNIIQPCFWKDIIDPIPDIGVYHDDFEEMCSKTLKELRKQENDDFWLKEILIEITKSLINHSKFETKVDACWLKEWILPKACEEIFNKGDELVNKVKENYIKLSEVLESIKNENPEINIDKYFYIPYNKVHDKSNWIIVGFFIDQEKAEQILKDIESEETN